MARGPATGTGRLLTPTTKGWPRGGDGDGVEIRMGWQWEWGGEGNRVEIRTGWQWGQDDNRDRVAMV